MERWLYNQPQTATLGERASAFIFVNTEAPETLYAALISDDLTSITPGLSLVTEELGAFGKIVHADPGARHAGVFHRTHAHEPSFSVIGCGP